MGISKDTWNNIVRTDPKNNNYNNMGHLKYTYRQNSHFLSLKHIFREHNRAADKLSRSGYKYFISCTYAQVTRYDFVSLSNSGWPTIFPLIVNY